MGIEGLEEVGLYLGATIKGVKEPEVVEARSFGTSMPLSW